jgi:hypothetical protein
MAEDLPGRAWVRNAYCAIVRASGFVSLKFDVTFLGKLRDYAASVRLADQVKYHKQAFLGTKPSRGGCAVSVQSRSSSPWSRPC